MASTLLSPNPHQCHDKAPPTSPSLQMPNVFIIPPEEDETPTWCCFDAAEAPPRVLSTSPNLHFLDTALSMFQTETEAPVFHRDSVGPFGSHNSVIMPRKTLETRSITDVMMDGENYESEDEMEAEYKEHPLTRGRSNGVGNDSEIVEVVKVGRHPHEPEAQAHPPTPPAKCSKSLKSRASKAFRSIKNVGKGSLRSKPRVQDIFTSKPVTAGELPPRSKSPTISRRGSAIFTQFFSPPTTLHSRSSVSSFDAVRAPPELHQEEGQISSFSGPSHTATTPRSSTVSTQDLAQQDIRSPSPTPSAQTFSNRRRFSVMSLQRLFSFSAETDASDSAPPGMSRDSTGPSTASSSSGPDTPTEEAAPLPAYQLQLHLDSIDNRSPFTRKCERGPVALEQGEISFEMKLDSLHFEALSFDADRF
ncbi:hypothetical protein Hypma_008861 [Hypsizygus marmoreus]|uniref:Uncharacterized protein n=1 Tax=Hypsizygus marmoreus TaxID=39966 RepID=A0A369JZP5_HYPMA|nr:hypothetical protein Hypma_008861 [Hypsizygus marmoreus]